MSQETDKQAEVLKYIKNHHIAEKLNELVNKMCRQAPEDPYAFLAQEFAELAKPTAITKLVGREVLDSRGNPTVEVDVYGNVLGTERLLARAGAPSGASTGSNEAYEMRDDDNKTRYLGKGVLTAVRNVNEALSRVARGVDPRQQKTIDDLMVREDGTPEKKRLGGNAITAASFAIAHAGAQVDKKELFLHLASIYHNGKLPTHFGLPRPMVNIVNGGKHAGGDLKIQEFMIVPRGGIPFKEAVQTMTTVYHHLGAILAREKGKSAKNLGDEGGFAPALSDPHEALKYIEQAIAAAGYKVGEDMFLALDCAASEFYADGKYEIEKGRFLTTDEAVQYYLKLKADHPALISIEDPLNEDDYEGWAKMTAAFAQQYKDVMIVGDDLYTTNPRLIERGIQAKWANALLLKVNQIGTVSEAMQAARMIFASGGNVAVSHRSGETVDSIISDLAVAIGAQFIKTGAPARGERVSKYNRLLAIEEYLESKNMLKML